MHCAKSGMFPNKKKNDNGSFYPQVHRGTRMKIV